MLAVLVACIMNFHIVKFCILGVWEPVPEFILEKPIIIGKKLENAESENYYQWDFNINSPLPFRKI